METGGSLVKSLLIVITHPSQAILMSWDIKSPKTFLFDPLNVSSVFPSSPFASPFPLWMMPIEIFSHSSRTWKVSHHFQDTIQAPWSHLYGPPGSYPSFILHSYISSLHPVLLLCQTHPSRICQLLPATSSLDSCSLDSLECCSPTSSPRIFFLSLETQQKCHLWTPFQTLLLYPPAISCYGHAETIVSSWVLSQLLMISWPCCTVSTYFKECVYPLSRLWALWEQLCELKLIILSDSQVLNLSNGDNVSHTFLTGHCKGEMTQCVTRVWAHKRHSVNKHICMILLAGTIPVMREFQRWEPREHPIAPAEFSAA